MTLDENDVDGGDETVSGCLRLRVDVCGSMTVFAVEAVYVYRSVYEEIYLCLLYVYCQEFQILDHVHCMFTGRSTHESKHDGKYNCVYSELKGYVYSSNLCLFFTVNMMKKKKKKFVVFTPCLPYVY